MRQSIIPDPDPDPETTEIKGANASADDYLCSACEHNKLPPSMNRNTPALAGDMLTTHYIPSEQSMITPSFANQVSGFT